MSDFYLHEVISLGFQSPISLKLVLEYVHLGVQLSGKAVQMVCLYYLAFLYSFPVNNNWINYKNISSIGRVVVVLY